MIDLSALHSDPLLTIHGDCVEVMRSMPEASVDAIVTDPPYGIGFMGREWDTFSPERVRHRALTLRRKGTQRKNEAYPEKAGVGQGGGTPIEYDYSLTGAQKFEAWTEAWALEALRVLRPGGYLLSFCGTRMAHRMTSGIEDAGFEIRDCLSWLYGSGFPKSLDVSKAIDKAKGAEREVVGYDATRARPNRVGKVMGDKEYDRSDNGATLTGPATDLAKQWDGWGTALKPAWEPIILARKPLIGTVAENVEKHGTGALNIDGTRIGAGGGTRRSAQAPYPRKPDGTEDRSKSWARTGHEVIETGEGRWPANVVLDEQAAAMLDEQSGDRGAFAPVRGTEPTKNRAYQANAFGVFAGDGRPGAFYGDRGGASRFFYTAKADREDRGKGNTHPTVKPVDLMRWLVRLVTPPGGIVLDPFAGSGTTGQAALAEGFRCVLIEKEAEYVEGIRQWRAAMQLGLGLAVGE